MMFRVCDDCRDAMRHHIQREDDVWKDRLDRVMAELTHQRRLNDHYLTLLAAASPFHPQFVPDIPQDATAMLADPQPKR